MLKNEINYIKNILLEGTDQILLNNNIKLEITQKGKQDLVTRKDFLMEEFIIEHLKIKFPNDKIIAEESINEKLTDQLTWVIDPIDGTINFSNNSPLYGIQIARLENKEPIFSAMYFPKFDEFHYAIKNNGFYINGERYLNNKKINLSNSIVSFGDFSNSNPSSRLHQLKLLKILNSKCLKTRIQGASSIDFSFVASGKTQCHILFSKNIWELKPGLLLVKESGGSIYKYKGDKYGFEGYGYVLSNNKGIEKEIITILETL